MELTIGLFLLIVALAFIGECLDSSLGMGYGTILSPLLIIFGFEPLAVVPAILISQALGGLTASIFHHRFNNVSFTFESRDLKIAAAIIIFGVIAAIVGASTAIRIPKVALKTYIGALVTIMGIIILRNKRYIFSWKKIIGIGLISAFNKGISGGGFGPIVTAGQIISGQKHKAAIGVTTLAEAPICLVSFLTYVITVTLKESPGAFFSISVKEFARAMVSSKSLHWELTLALVLGAILVAPLGPFITKRINEKKIHLALGALILIVGLWQLWETYF
ncbi:MAG: sulfite exporter TauE/SafE family protein [Candidatus Omnitrophica bacterium]|nr:sulfite exporter TauE/SafE family protein [Candidatus Omnitrophota bacterium]